MQSTKVDIVYYLIPTDFEMEFNLSGCCRMRLLTALTHDRKEYVGGLSRAVSRSKIIIACGPLYGDDGLIYMTSKAIGKPLTIINNKDYGIADDHNVRIIEGSLPLVTNSGIFGGIIIESGPQTIIILSETKSVRKNIMENLIHPYIQELSIMDIRMSNSVPAAKEQPAEAIDNTVAVVEAAGVVAAEAISADNGDTADTSDEEQPTAEETAEEVKVDGDKTDTDRMLDEIKDEPTESAPSDEALEKVAMEINRLTEQINLNENTAEPENTAPGEEEFNIFTSPSQIDFTIDDAEENVTNEKKTAPAESSEKKSQPTAKTHKTSESDEKFASAHPVFVFKDPSNETEEGMALDNYLDSKGNDGHSEKHKKRRNKPLIISIIIIAVLLLFIIAASCYFVFYIPYLKGISTQEFLNDVFSTSKSITLFLR